MEWRSGTRRERAQEFNNALRDEGVAGVLWAVGGYAATHILDLLDYDAFRRSPKVICGYSDATVLHHALYAVSGCVTFYGPAVLTQMGECPAPHPFTVNEFKRVVMEAGHGLFPRCEDLIEEYVDWALDSTQPRRVDTAPPREALRGGTSAGPLLAGCLPSALQLLGTPWQPDYRDHVLVLEFPDVDYGPAQADKDLWQLRHAGLLDGIAALVVGRPRLWKAHAREQLRVILGEVLEGTSYPVVTEFETGHTDPMLTLPIGVPVEVSGTDVTLLEPAVF
ncbi:muramoyltetrapeptide carboxypeptidase LdcA involved in peptidoglycan recycling [Streptosporangium becharense]|uniref:Muramoyltetrapeptide carboxypeptidase LdcA involved in peptidoglycan recycling n=2 Tax=Streptosporangium becharense TaxID=1816182 RepID=A0A7W9IKA7_9ACTN|nr:muramoyltetrapeptide carboxypeptidase LdcA involved in peptidoglycan recycling [Streptosporangium becharense]MBB5821634.1 muramoyltetrapeptide carboxypeptidase LdcA involved in peptidoglycan recycling [Streptosporangium becharense]